MNNRLDHLEEELSEWKSREQRFEKLFGPAILQSNAYLKEKLALYERLEMRYGASDAGSTIAKLLREQRRQVERKVYPNLAVRLLYRLVKAVLPGAKTFSYEKAILSNYKQLHGQVKASGFAVSENQLEQMVRQGNREFSIPVSYFVSEKEKIDFDLKFQRDTSGNYKLEQYHAKYQNMNTNGQTRSSTFNGNQTKDINAGQAYNLLAGRAAFIGQDEKQWVQLDFNDKDAAGNFKMKVFPAGYGFDLSKSLNELGLAKSMNHASRAALMESLQQGNRVELALENGKKMAIEANPQKQRLDRYENGVLKNDTVKNRSNKDFAQTRQVNMKVIKHAKAKGI